jgi:GMP synthase (glutamine-hydrolysing)
MKLLLLNCYPQASREKFTRDGVTQPHDLFTRVLKRRAPSAQTEIVFAADPGVRLPPGTALTDYNGILWTGSDLTAYLHDDERVARMIDFAKEGFARGISSYGSCWGLQIAAAAAGGRVEKMTKGREWGVTPGIELTSAGQKNPLHSGKPAIFSGFEMHLDEVTRLPSGSEALSTGEHCAIQSALIRYGKGEFWATQFHCEYDLREMARLIRARAAPLIKEGFFPDSAAVDTHADKMEHLHLHPTDTELSRELGADAALLDPDLRELELANWLKAL